MSQKYRRRPIGDDRLGASIIHVEVDIGLLITFVHSLGLYRPCPCHLISAQLWISYMLSQLQNPQQRGRGMNACSGRMGGMCRWVHSARRT